jgi:hypothetical protein
MAAKLTRLTHKIDIQLYLVAESCTICSPAGLSGNFWIHLRMYHIKMPTESKNVGYSTN